MTSAAATADFFFVIVLVVLVLVLVPRRGAPAEYHPHSKMTE